MGSFGGVRGDAGGASPHSRGKRGARRHVVVVAYGRRGDRLRPLARCSVMEAEREPTVRAATLNSTSSSWSDLPSSGGDHESHANRRPRHEMQRVVFVYE